MKYIYYQPLCIPPMTGENNELEQAFLSIKQCIISLYLCTVVVNEPDLIDII